MKIRFSPIAALLAVLAAFVSSSCSDEKTSGSPAPRQVDMLVLFYMGGDNNLSAEVAEKTDALMRGWSARPGDRLLIFSDASGEPARLSEIKNTGGGPALQNIKNYGEVNSADGAMLSRVIRDVKRRYNAASCGLVVFSHGTGWFPAGAIDNPADFTIAVNDWDRVCADIELRGTRTIIVDGQDEADVAELAAAIPDHAFDFIVFEACLMSGVEVAYEFKDKADYIMASSAEILSPGFTDIYSRYADYLFDKDLGGFAQKAFEHYDGQSGYKRSATFSLIKTSALDALARWAGENCDFQAAVEVGAVQRFNRTGFPLVFDLGDYYSRITPPDRQAELERLIDDCVVWKKASPDFLRGMTNWFEIKRHSGLTSYIMQPTYAALNREYARLKWSREVLSR